MCDSIYVCVFALRDGRDGPLQSVSIWKHSVLVCCFNLRCVGCLNSRITKKRQTSAYSYTQKDPHRDALYTQTDFVSLLSSGGPTDGQAGSNGAAQLLK